jgi:predicted nucleic acid-binding protein
LSVYLDASALVPLFANDALSDTWIARETERAQTTAADVSSASNLIRRLDLTLRAADAIHIAIAQRLDADIFDIRPTDGGRSASAWNQSGSALDDRFHDSSHIKRPS